MYFAEACRLVSQAVLTAAALSPRQAACPAPGSPGSPGGETRCLPSVRAAGWPKDLSPGSPAALQQRPLPLEARDAE